MVHVGTISSRNFVSPRAIAQIAAGLGGRDNDFDFGGTVIFPRLELRQDRVAATDRFLIWLAAYRACTAARLPALYSFSQVAARAAKSELSAATAAAVASIAPTAEAEAGPPTPTTPPVPFRMLAVEAAAAPAGLAGSSRTEIALSELERSPSWLYLFVPPQVVAFPVTFVPNCWLQAAGAADEYREDLQHEKSSQTRHRNLIAVHKALLVSNLKQTLD